MNPKIPMLSPLDQKEAQAKVPQNAMLLVRMGKKAVVPKRLKNEGAPPLNWRHGHGVNGRQSKTYCCWQSMLQRCLNANHKEFKRYGGRGISVCPEWQLGFVVFLRDMGEKPDGHCLDRIDNNQGYCKENCRWVTPKESANNRRSNKRMTIDGIYETMTNHAKRLGVSTTCIRYRIGTGKLTDGGVWHHTENEIIPLPHN